LSFLCPTSLPADTIYEVIDLGTLGGDWSEAYSINDASRIVGWSDKRATLFDATGAGNNIDLGTLGGRNSEAYSINNVNQVVGRAVNNQGDRRATLFDSTGGGNNIDLGALGGLHSEALSINNAGQIVGWAEYEMDIYHYHRATLFDHSGIDPTGAGNNIDLGTLGGRNSEAISINDAGQIVGQAELSEIMWLYNHATLFDPTGAGNNIDLGTLGGDESKALSINDAGQIVGVADLDESMLWSYHATLFDPTGAGDNIDLGTLGGDWSEALSINDASQIVGWAYNSQGWQLATLFDPTGAGNNIDLNTLIDPNSGWFLYYALDINASGWIVGGGYNPQGEDPRAFLLVPKSQCAYKLVGDLNDDCKVDFADFAVMATNWLVDCELYPTDPACVPKELVLRR
jgi:probable HAF family extracellular repeat protein